MKYLKINPIRLIKKIINKNIIFKFLFLFFILNTANAKKIEEFNKILDLSIEPYCNGANLKQNNFFTLDQLDSIDIRFKNSKRFYVGLLKVMTSPTTYHREIFLMEKQKNHKADLFFVFKNNQTCEFEANIRVHGDGIDHYQFIDGNPTSSMHVELNKDSIDGITKFKLFIPSAEGGDNEIFNSILFRKLGYLSPRTVNTKIKLHNKYYKFIFQEVLAKEMLENNKKRDGAIIEKNEDSAFGLGRIDNKSWLKKNLRNKLIGSKIINDFNVSLIKAINNSKIRNYNIDNVLAHISFIDYDYLSSDIKNLDILANFETLAFATNSEHTLAMNDRRFYYDEITGHYHPIYYDGESYLFKNIDKHDFSKVTKYSKRNINEIRKRLNEIDLTEFLINLQNSNVDITMNELKKYFNKININLEKIEKSKVEYISSESNNLAKVFNFVDKDVKFVFGDEKMISVCSNNFSNCQDIENNITFFDSLIKQRFQKNNPLNLKPFYISYFGNISKKYSGENIINQSLVEITKQHKGVNDWNYLPLEGDIFIKYLHDITITVDHNNKELLIYYKNILNRAVITGGDTTLKNWSIELVFDEEIHNNNTNLVDSSSNLTGCLTLIDVKIENLTIKSNDAICEDSVNLIRTDGSIKKLIINNSISDGFDADFSNIKFDNIYISNSKNDCIDFSSGSYTLEKITLNKCGDKGVSIGEKSLVDLKQISITNSKIAIAVKDSSKLNIQKNKFFNNEYCLLSYRKKQEFKAPHILFINNLSCDYEKVLIQKGTLITDLRK